MIDIEKQIDKMSEKDQERLEELVIDRANERDWCNMYGIDYVNPDFDKVREEVYKQFFEKKYLEKKHQ